MANNNNGWLYGFLKSQNIKQEKAAKSIRRERGTFNQKMKYPDSFTIKELRKLARFLKMDLITLVTEMYR